MPEIIERWTLKEAQACWGDGCHGHDHIRQTLANLLPCTYTVCPEIRELMDALRAPMSDDASEEDEALELLNAACEDGIYWALDCGDLILFKDGYVKEVNTMPHDFTKCQDSHGQQVRCIKCGITKFLADMYADLNGTAFVAYYCATCRHSAYKDNDGAL